MRRGDENPQENAAARMYKVMRNLYRDMEGEGFSEEARQAAVEGAVIDAVARAAERGLIKVDNIGGCATAREGETVQPSK